MADAVGNPARAGEALEDLKSDQRLKQGSIGAIAIVILVVATATPLAGSIGNTPLAIGLGNGIATPGAFLAAGIVLALFAVGYAAMSRHITNAGAFFAYITAGLGHRLGTSAGFVAILSYNVLAVYVLGFFGFFADSVVTSELGLDLPWWVYGIGAFLVALALGIRGIEISARVLGVILATEMTLLTIFNVAVLVNNGFGAFPTASFDPGDVLGAGAGVALMFAFLSFIGFEATAIFSEEAKDPRRTVPRATFIALGVLTFFYVVTAWCMIASAGATTAQKAAAEDPGVFFFAAAGTELGSWASSLFSWVMLAGLFAVVCSIHNMSSRYLLAFGREGLLPKQLGRTHPRYKTPLAAAVVQVAFTVAVALIYVIAGADPYLNLVAQMAGLGTLGVVALQALTAAAVIGFFLRRPHRNFWKTIVAPALACAGLVAACVLILSNYSLLSGSDSGIVNQLPWLLVIVAVIGYVVGAVHPLQHPIDVFASTDAEPAPAAEPALSRGGV